MLKNGRGGGLLFHRDDDAAEEDALAGEEDGEGGEGGEEEGGLDDAGAGALLELVEPDHQRPHFGVLADEQGVHEIGVGDGEGLEGNDGKDGRGESHGDVPKEGPFSGAVELGGFVEVAREGVEEAFEQKDGVAAGHAGEEEGGERIEKAEFAQQNENGDLRDHVREGHGEHQEEKNLRRSGEAGAAEGVGGEGIDEEGEKHGEGAINDGVEDASPVEENVVEHGSIVAEEKFAAEFGFVFAEQRGVVGELGKGGRRGRGGIKN